MEDREQSYIYELYDGCGDKAHVLNICEAPDNSTAWKFFRSRYFGSNMMIVKFAKDGRRLMEQRVSFKP